MQPVYIPYSRSRSKGWSSIPRAEPSNALSRCPGKFQINQPVTLNLCRMKHKPNETHGRLCTRVLLLPEPSEKMGRSIPDGSAYI